MKLKKKNKVNILYTNSNSSIKYITTILNRFREFHCEKVFGEVIFGGRSTNENLESLGININRCLVRIRNDGGATVVTW